MDCPACNLDNPLVAKFLSAHPRCVCDVVTVTDPAELVSENEGGEMERGVLRVRNDLAFLYGDRGGPNHKNEMKHLADAFARGRG